MAKLVYFVSILPGRKQTGANADTGAVDASLITDPFERAVAEFQTHIEKSKNDSTAFLGKELYIYLHLVRSWFKYLSFKHQNDRETIRNMKENYIEYLLCMKEMQTTRFMFVKGGGAEEYRERYAAAKNKGRDRRCLRRRPGKRGGCRAGMRQGAPWPVLQPARRQGAGRISVRQI
ncbi:hypothetical protein WOA01_14345 [Methylocystis sp. IM2]|uniref:hypothetical protein n=1 Tax=unclassified Methylocystis TaxID=2625913 RepID=UPI0030F55DBB